MQQPPFDQPQWGQPPQQQPFPQQQPMQPQQPPRKSRRGLWIILAVVGSVLLLSCVLCGVVVAQTPVPKQAVGMTPTNAIATQAVTQAISVPTVQPTPQPTHPALQPGPAILGSDISTFIAKYGQPNDHSDVNQGVHTYHFQRYANSNVDGLLVQTDPFDGPSYVTLAYTVIAQADNGHPWDMAQAAAQGSVYAPHDAVYQSQMRLADGSINKIYYSASLAKDFPVSAFTDANGKAVRPGTFNILFLLTSDGHVSGCQLQIGA